MAIIPHEATAYLANKQLKTAWYWDEIYAAEHNIAFTVAKVMEQDILDTIHRQLTRAVEGGQTFHSFKRDLLQKLGQSGWGNYQQKDEKTGKVITHLSDSRLKKVYRINKRQAYHAGAWQRFQESKDTLPYLTYKLGTAKEHRPEHIAWEGITLPVDDPWWQTHMPMNGWGCKCWVRQISQAQAEKIGISESPTIDYHDWQSKATGRIHKVPKGIDPGFEHNVGIHRETKSLARVTGKLSQVVTQSPTRANKLMQSLITGANIALINNAMHKWIDDIAARKQARGEIMAVGVIPQTAIDALQKLDKAPYHNVIAVRDSDILHAIRDSKQAKGISLPLAFWQQLPSKLQRPDAILLQHKDGVGKRNALDTLIFVYNAEQGKLIVKMDYELKVKTGMGKETIKLNVVTTGQFVKDLSSLGAFEKIK